MLDELLEWGFEVEEETYIPKPKPGGPPHCAAYEHLLKMRVGHAANVNRGEDTVRSAIRRFRRFYDLKWRFVVRRLAPDKCRIWRVQ